MNTQRIRALLTAVDSGSLTGAALKLGYTQSAITKMMKSLESEVGFPLIVTTNRGIELTTEGNRLLPAMRLLIDADEKLQQEVGAIMGMQEGTLRIGSFVSISMQWLPGVLKYFQKAYPNIRIEIEENGHDELFRQLEERAVDVVLMSDTGKKKAIDFIPLVEDPMCVAFSPETNPELMKMDSIRLDDLKGYPLMMTDRSFDRDARRVLKSASFTPEIKYSSRDDFAVLSMVENGLGITVISELILRSYESDLVDYRLLEPEIFRTLGIGVRSMEEASPAVRTLIDFLKTHIH